MPQFSLRTPSISRFSRIPKSSAHLPSVGGNNKSSVVIQDKKKMHSRKYCVQKINNYFSPCEACLLRAPARRVRKKTATLPHMKLVTLCNLVSLAMLRQTRSGGHVWSNSESVRQGKKRGKHLVLPQMSDDKGGRGGGKKVLAAHQNASNKILVF